MTCLLYTSIPELSDEEKELALKMKGILDRIDDVHSASAWRILDSFTPVSYTHLAPEDIVVYSIDEVFMDVTDYLNTYKLSAHDLAMKIILDVLETTGITATAGIGTNLFLCKVACLLYTSLHYHTSNGSTYSQSGRSTM